jgi:ribonucleoside-triphosphate reductase
MQSPFVSTYININDAPEEDRKDYAMVIEAFLKQRLLGVKNKVGVYFGPAFPKVLYVLDENNVWENSEYYYLTELAAKCVSKRMLPDFISAKIMREQYDGEVFPCMGCRSFLQPYKDPKTGKYKWYGRFNQGVVTLNLADVGLSADKDIESFWSILDERLELCFQALMLRHERLLDSSINISPIHWKYGGLSRLSTDNFNELLFNDYSSISLGYAGLYECVKSLIGKSHTTKEGKALGLEIMKHLKETCDKWKKETNIGFSLYGTPLESTTYKLAKCLKKRFGDDVFIKLDGQDRDYITNSYHVNVAEEIEAKDKLLFEAEFQKYSSGGCISYVETCNLSSNIDVIIDLIQFMYENIRYAELNGKFDYCQECGYEGEILLDDNNQWYCPNCGNRNHNTMNVARRTCGYIGDNFWNEGRTDEIKNRYVHVDNKEANIELDEE